MKKLIAKIKAFFKKLVTYKPRIYSIVEVTYKSVYVLNTVLLVAIESAQKLDLDTKAVVKIRAYIEKILTAVTKLVDTLGIEVGIEFINDVNALVTEQVKQPRSDSKTALTLGDVVESYGAAFEKLDEILAEPSTGK